MPPLPIADPRHVAPIDLAACPPDALAALGPVLCLHVAGEAHPLSGLRRAARVIAQVRLDSDGPHEQLRFFDARGDCCWRLHLLPDSDYLSWERLLMRMPVESESPARRITETLWRRFAKPHWRACAVRLHAVAEGDRPGLAMSDVMLSTLGLACARRIIRGLAPPASREPPAAWADAAIGSTRS